MSIYPEKVEKWKCNWYGCAKLHNEERGAMKCLYNHVKERMINIDLAEGYTLEYINRVYALEWKLTEEQKRIDKHSCFTISYLQCCDYPAYKISSISHDGKITVFGRGSWSGAYSSVVRLENLENPRPPEELYIYKERES